jgi:transposase
VEVIHPRCAGVDVSKKDAKVCVRVQGRGRRGTSTTVSTWGSTTAEILALGEHLLAEQVSCVVIESTSDYWKPFYYLLEEQLPVMLVNAKAARNVPGRKTDLCRMRRGWPIWAPTGWCAPRLCPQSRFGCCGI